jgi:hypothetical protein
VSYSSSGAEGINAAAPGACLTLGNQAVDARWEVQA